MRETDGYSGGIVDTPLADRIYTLNPPVAEITLLITRFNTQVNRLGAIHGPVCRKRKRRVLKFPFTLERSFSLKTIGVVDKIREYALDAVSNGAGKMTMCISTIVRSMK